MAKLSERELVCAEVLVGSGGRQRAQREKDLGVDESTLRYRLEWRRQGAVDGRSRQAEASAPFEGVIHDWIERQPWDSTDGRNRPESIRIL